MRGMIILATIQNKKTEQELKQEKLDKLMEGVDAWASFFRANPHRFVREFLGIILKRFQEIILCMMFRFPNAIYLAARGAGKTFILALFCITYSILYPGAIIQIASRTRSQATEVIKQILKIINGGDVPEFIKNEILQDKVSPSEAFIKWKNGSYTAVVTAGESGRGQRAHVLIIDEFRLVDRDIIETILKKFLAVPRMPGYLSKPEYKNLPKERTKMLYASSAWYKGHWSYELVESFVINMLKNGADGGHFCCTIPYHVPYMEGLLDYERLQEDMSEAGFNEVTFRIEMEGLFYGLGSGGLYSFDDLDKNRKIKYPFYPRSYNYRVADKRLFIPEKRQGEVRILSADIALISSRKSKNDATSIVINQMLPLGNGKYIKNIVYLENNEGLRTDAQALNIRRLFDDYDCDYLVIDVKGLGVGVTDLIMGDIYDQSTGTIYGALSCYNDEEWAKRCLVKGAPKVIWVINGSDKLNSDCAMILRDEFRQGRIKLLCSEIDAEDLMRELLGNKAWESLTLQERMNLQLPYLNTRLLIDELINLECETTKGTVKVKEKPGARKDRYSSISYNIYVAREIERQMQQKNSRNYDGGIFNIQFKPPMIKSKRG